MLTNTLAAAGPSRPRPAPLVNGPTSSPSTHRHDIDAHYRPQHRASLPLPFPPQPSGAPHGGANAQIGGRRRQSARQGEGGGMSTMAMAGGANAIPTHVSPRPPPPPPVRHPPRAFSSVAANACGTAALSPASSPPVWNTHSWGGVPPPPPLATSRPPSVAVVSVDDVIGRATEKKAAAAQGDFWAKYQDIQTMSNATKKEDIIAILDNFAMIHRKHVYMFQRLKSTILTHMRDYDAKELASIVHSFVVLGFLHEDFVMAMTPQVIATAHLCTPSELTRLLDSYASLRCHVSGAIEVLTRETLRKVSDFTISDLMTHASSFARLNLHHAPLFRSIAAEMQRQGADGEGGKLTARELTLAAYSFAKLGFHFPHVFEFASRHAKEVIRDFTAHQLQMMAVAFQRAGVRDVALFQEMSIQAQRRMAQFNAESIALLLRSFSLFDIKDESLFTRVVVQLPRLILTFRPIDIATTLNAFARLQVVSPALMEIVVPAVQEQIRQFTAADMQSILHAFARLGFVDCTFLATYLKHCTVSHLTAQQLVHVATDLAKLSFRNEAFMQAVSQEVLHKMPYLTPSMLAQVYAAYVQLGLTSGAFSEFQRTLAKHIRYAWGYNQWAHQYAHQYRQQQQQQHHKAVRAAPASMSPSSHTNTSPSVDPSGGLLPLPPPPPSHTAHPRCPYPYDVTPLSPLSPGMADNDIYSPHPPPPPHLGGIGIGIGMAGSVPPNASSASSFVFGQGGPQQPPPPPSSPLLALSPCSPSMDPSDVVARVPGVGENAPAPLSLSSCVTLCFASLMAPPPPAPLRPIVASSDTPKGEGVGVGGGKSVPPPPVLGEGWGSTAEHPVDPVLLVGRCISEKDCLSEEEVGILNLVRAGFSLMPWNRRAIQAEQSLSFTRHATMSSGCIHGLRAGALEKETEFALQEIGLILRHECEIPCVMHMPDEETLGERHTYTTYPHQHLSHPNQPPPPPSPPSPIELGSETAPFEADAMNEASAAEEPKSEIKEAEVGEVAVAVAAAADGEGDGEGEGEKPSTVAPVDGEDGAAAAGGQPDHKIFVNPFHTYITINIDELASLRDAAQAQQEASSAPQDGQDEDAISVVSVGSYNSSESEESQLDEGEGDGSGLKASHHHHHHHHVPGHPCAGGWVGTGMAGAAERAEEEASGATMAANHGHGHQKQVAILWGSSMHYWHDVGSTYKYPPSQNDFLFPTSDHTKAPGFLLTPAAKFQLRCFQERMRNTFQRVYLIPHYHWNALQSPEAKKGYIQNLLHKGASPVPPNVQPDSRPSRSTKARARRAVSERHTPLRGEAAEASA
ncbi:unnamed protein product [Vitrella brassicaformis CCMP3155]|uniref:RNA-editing substrate-binding complex 6 protein domain-containing protein n=5 Tax=Vitrella brassicaformis TaxID=1169539 RepID=A0A0G4FAQ5_VITBC|nr:unnamed protein product [Vitrella brassicaformis CCMP3155]|eukprot:CEM09673.1 unnamed protein product [Vitrella brassicaformis CCMP3155]